jgi:hypothetical protein
MDDHFRPIDDFPGYRVSKTGQVESCWTRRGRHCVSSDKWRPLKPILRQGYPTVNLAKGGKKSARRIHRLVLEAFVGPCPPGMVACHNDGNRSNSDLANVRWDTPKANSDDTLRHGTRATGSRCGATKLSEVQVIEIRRLRTEGVSFGDLAARFNVTTYNIKAIVYRRSWKHLLGEKGGDDVSGSESLGGRDLRQGAMS